MVNFYTFLNEKTHILNQCLTLHTMSHIHTEMQSPPPELVSQVPS